MLRFATNQTSRALFRSRTIPRVAQSVRHHSAGVTEGAQSVFPTLAMTGTTVLLGSSIWEQRRSDKKKIKMEQKMSEMKRQMSEIRQEGIKIKREQMEKEFTKARAKNTHQMSFEWSSIDPSREAVLNKTYKSNRYLKLHKLLGMANNSKPDKATRAPQSVANIMHFFLRWKNRHDDDTINSVGLKEYLGSEFGAFRDILIKIRDHEARDWDEADSDILNEVIDFLDEVSKMETKGSGES